MLSDGCPLTTAKPVIVEAGAKSLIPEDLFVTPEMYDLFIWQGVMSNRGLSVVTWKGLHTLHHKY
jgi:hypothetical protein